MWIVIRKRIVSIMVLLALIVAAVGPIIPRAAAAAPPCAMTMSLSMANDHPSDTDDYSSKGAMPVCGWDLGCIIASALPTPFAPTVTDLVWEPVRYWDARNALAGLSTTPEPFPPKSRA